MLGGRAGQSSAAGAARARADEPPSFRVPGASVAAVAAAKASASSSNGTWASKVGGAVPGAAAAPAQRGASLERTAAGNGPAEDGLDDEGFQQVARRNRRKGQAADVGGAATQGQGRHTDAGAVSDDDGDLASGDADAAGGDDDGDQPPTIADLQQAWRDEIALIKKLRGQGVQDGHPAMCAAREARDAAEQAWRTAKEPAPPAVRLGRAQSKLDRAVVLQSEARQAILEEERGHRERLAALQATMDTCTERVALRRRQVQEIQAEVGAAGGNGGVAMRAQMEAIKAVHGTICQEVGPTLAALAEQVGTETPAWATLNSLLAKLADTKATLEGATSRPASQYHIGDGEDRWESCTDWSESHDVHGQHWGRGGARQGQDQGGEQAMDDGTGDEAMGTDQWWDTPTRRWGAAAKWQPNGYGQWSRASWADHLEAEMEDDQDGDGQPPTVRRRLGGQGSGDEQQQSSAPPQPPRPAAPQAASAGGPSDDPHERQRKHQARINHIIALAVESGVTPLTSSGEELVMLGPEQLEEWVASCLPSALLC